VVRIRPTAEYSGKRITDRQIEVLSAVNERGSINSAAKLLNITPPVAYRHIRELEKTIGKNVLSSGPRGSVITEDGAELLRTITTAETILSRDRRFTIACTPVTEELMMSSISSSGVNADLIISDDERNIAMLKQNDAELVILDDPVHVFDDDSLNWKEIGQMGMVHVDKGTSYMRYRYGAQRIAFRYLDSIGEQYTIDGETLSLTDLLDSGKSFFVDEVLLMRKGIRIHSATDPSILRHAILAVYANQSDNIEKVVSEVLKKR